MKKVLRKENFIFNRLFTYVILKCASAETMSWWQFHLRQIDILSFWNNLIFICIVQLCLLLLMWGRLKGKKIVKIKLVIIIFDIPLHQTWCWNYHHRHSSLFSNSFSFVAYYSFYLDLKLLNLSAYIWCQSIDLPILNLLK